MPSLSAGPLTRRRLLALGGLATAANDPVAVAASGDQRGANRRPALSWSARVDDTSKVKAELINGTA